MPRRTRAQAAAEAHLQDVHADSGMKRQRRDEPSSSPETRAITFSSACHRVLETPELLRRILLNADSFRDHGDKVHFAALKTMAMVKKSFWGEVFRLRFKKISWDQAMTVPDMPEDYITARAHAVRIIKRSGFVERGKKTMWMRPKSKDWLQFTNTVHELKERYPGLREIIVRSARERPIAHVEFDNAAGYEGTLNLAATLEVELDKTDWLERISISKLPEPWKHWKTTHVLSLDAVNWYEDLRDLLMHSTRFHPASQEILLDGLRSSKWKALDPLWHRSSPVKSLSFIYVTRATVQDMVRLASKCGDRLERLAGVLVRLEDLPEVTRIVRESFRHLISLELHVDISGYPVYTQVRTDIIPCRERSPLATVTIRPHPHYRADTPWYTVAQLVCSLGGVNTTFNAKRVVRNRFPLMNEDYGLFSELCSFLRGQHPASSFEHWSRLSPADLDITSEHDPWETCNAALHLTYDERGYPVAVKTAHALELLTRSKESADMEYFVGTSKLRGDKRREVEAARDLLATRKVEYEERSWDLGLELDKQYDELRELRKRVEEERECLQELQRTKAEIRGEIVAPGAGIRPASST